MPPNLEFQFSYAGLPIIFVRVFSPDSNGSAITEALIDTGADVSIFDTRVAEDLGIALDGRRTISLRGINGDEVQSPMTEVELQLLGEPDLSVRSLVAFLPDILDTVGNLIGRDVLEYLDFGLEHSLRIGYLGRTESPP